MGRSEGAVCVGPGRRCCFWLRGCGRRPSSRTKREANIVAQRAGGGHRRSTSGGRRAALGRLSAGAVPEPNAIHHRQNHPTTTVSLLEGAVLVLDCRRWLRHSQIPGSAAGGNEVGPSEAAAVARPVGCANTGSSAALADGACERGGGGTLRECCALWDGRHYCFRRWGYGRRKSGRAQVAAELCVQAAASHRRLRFWLRASERCPGPAARCRPFGVVGRS